MSEDSPTSPNDLPDDDWDLDDDELSLGESIKPSPKALPAQKPEAPVFSTSQPKEIPQEEPRPVPRRESPVSADAPASQPLAEPEPEATPPSPRLSRSDPAESGPSSGSQSHLLEKISLLAVLVCLVGVAIWTFSNFLTEAPEGELVAFTSDFPVESDSLTIEAVETWWREPITEGDDADVGVVLGTQLIPCASITLKSSETANLQISFRDGEDKLIGDIINLSVENGRFRQSDSNEIIIHATAGFPNASDLHPYTLGEIDPWSLVIVEESNLGNPIVKARVSPNLIDH